MSGWQAKRFWSQARVETLADGFGVTLDGRPLRTPAKAQLVLPTAALAEAITAEWQAQTDVIDPASMPVTRSANAAIDKVTPQFEDVARHVEAYGGSDLLCYRVEAPAELARRQALAWDPLLDWLSERHGARLWPTTGVVHRPQPDAALAALGAAVRAQTAFGLTALSDLVSLSGSLVIGLAALEPDAACERLWSASRIDEDWQAEQWGQDAEAAAAELRRQSDFVHARRFWCLAHPPG